MCTLALAYSIPRQLSLSARERATISCRRKFIRLSVALHLNNTSLKDFHFAARQRIAAKKRTRGRGYIRIIRAKFNRVRRYQFLFIIEVYARALAQVYNWPRKNCNTRAFREQLPKARSRWNLMERGGGGAERYIRRTFAMARGQSSTLRRRERSAYSHAAETASCTYDATLYCLRCSSRSIIAL